MRPVAASRQSYPNVQAFGVPALPSMRFRIATVIALVLPALAPAQTRDTAVIDKSSNPLLSDFRFRSIGPASMGGRWAVQVDPLV